MTEYELAEYLTTLLGANSEGGSSELQEFDPTVAGDLIERGLPQDITAEMFAVDMLGFGMYGGEEIAAGVGEEEEEEASTAGGERRENTREFTGISRGGTAIEGV